jgi:hypothetical protein
MKLNIHSISRVTRPMPRSFDKVHGVIIRSPCPGVSSGEIMVEAMGCALGSVSTAVAIAEWYGSRITSLNHRQSP